MFDSMYNLLPVLKQTKLSESFRCFDGNWSLLSQAFLFVPQCFVCTVTWTYSVPLKIPWYNYVYMGFLVDKNNNFYLTLSMRAFLHRPRAYFVNFFCTFKYVHERAHTCRLVIYPPLPSHLLVEGQLLNAPW